MYIISLSQTLDLWQLFESLQIRQYSFLTLIETGWKKEIVCEREIKKNITVINMKCNLP